MRHNNSMKKFINLFIPLFIIILISLITLFDYDKTYFCKQLAWIVLGLILLIIGKFINYDKVFKYSKYLYFFNVILLVLVLIFGNEVNGSRAWFDFNYFSFQPSELMKLSLALYLADFFSKKRKGYFFKSLFILLIPSILVFLEPDTGAIIMYLVIYAATLFYVLNKKKPLYLLTFLGITLIGGVIFLYFYNVDLLIKILGTSIFYRMDRLINFQNNYQLENALISMGTASLFRRSKNAMLYIPESVTDFIFARVVSQYGFIIGIIILFCYFFILIYFIKEIKNKTKHSIFVNAFFWLFLFQILQNILMNIGLIPIMGIPLPFLSYGGSNTIIYFIFLMIIINRKNPLVRIEF